MSSSGFVDTVDLSMNNLYAKNYEDRLVANSNSIDAVETDIANNDVKTNTKALQTLTAGQSNSNKTGLSI